MGPMGLICFSPCENTVPTFKLKSVRDSGKSSLGLAGSLLIAHPNLLDPNFRRTILYLSTSDFEEGSFGFIINRPTGKTVEELLPDTELGELDSIPVFYGGPVAQDQLTFAAFQWNEKKQLVSCRSHLVIAEARELTLSESTVVRAFIGYSGWNKGQLEAELDEKAWLVQKPDQDVLDLEKCEVMWQTIMREQGAWFRLLAAAPDDPSQN